MADPRFLTVDDVLTIHHDQITRYGGSLGVREPGLLQSAVSQAEASFGGQYLHEDLFHMAAAYLFHIAQNHPFVDGNKRAGGVAAITFLYLNGYKVLGEESRLEELVMAVAQGQFDKPAIAAFFQEHAEPRT